MAKLSAFNFMTLNGYFKGINDDTSWHQHGNEEEGEFAAEGAQSDSIILFGRKTYDMMAGFWPTPEALKIMPAVAEGMNRSEKIVFSRTLKEAHWQNTKIISTGMVEEVKKLKASAKKDMVILGSGPFEIHFFSEWIWIDLNHFWLAAVSRFLGFWIRRRYWRVSWRSWSDYCTRIAGRRVPAARIITFDTSVSSNCVSTGL